MMTSAQIRQSFLDFFAGKSHTIVPSSSLMPDSPNLLFTNAGMNQFVPIFLGERRADVSTWAGVRPGSDTRAADTQKCIRAGGKHNDLDDVGLDTYHHTFFEMLGNWSFGDYFKREAIHWAWELVVERWGFPANRLYATIYNPDKAAGDPSERDEEAWAFWAEKFRSKGLDPAVHIVNGNKKDNFWMMGDTGPCGPCSELHVDLTPAGDTGGTLVNSGDARCIEIWNLVFIQYNANADGSFSPLPARHVDTGMGFERVTSIIQGTKNFTDFANAKISNYETDIFRPIFDAMESLSGKKYGHTLPVSGSTGETEQEKIDVAFRVIADHIRTLGFAIADGIQPGNTDRNYVLRRILRRAVRYGRALGFQEPFFYKLVPVLAREMGEVFPEIRTKQKHVEETLRREEEAFNRTLDKGIELFNREAAQLLGSARDPRAGSGDPPESSPAPRAEGAKYSKRRLPHFERPWGKYHVTFSTLDRLPLNEAERDIVLECLLFPQEKTHYELYAACVLPDHVHVLFEPQVKETDAAGHPIFYSLTELLQGIKSVSSHRINKLRGTSGTVWQKESFDRLIRSEADLTEKFSSICRNPFDAGLQDDRGGYRWLWTPGNEAAGGSPSSAREGACAPRISGEFAFKLYDEQGFPLDLTELMARERGLSVDTAGFEELMEAQRTRARAAQKKQVIELSEVETKEPTRFDGYDHLETAARVLEVVTLKDKTAVVLDASVCYAEMGGQVGDRGQMVGNGQTWTVANTQKIGRTWLHFLEGDDAPAVGTEVHLRVDQARRDAIQRHHTVTHLLHWALHEVVSPEATQKGSFVGPEKLTFDFNGAALTPEQVRDVEKRVNERIAENAPVSWTETLYADVRGRSDIMQFFGDKYGDTVRVVQIGGRPGQLDGYSMELCAGTHTRTTGEIGSFRIVSESAIAAGMRRIEAVAGDAVSDWARQEAGRQQERWETQARKKPGLAPLPDLATGSTILASLDARTARLEALENEVREWEKQSAKAAEAELKTRALVLAGELAEAHPEVCVAEIPGADGKLLQAIVESLRPRYGGPVFLAGVANGRVALIASLPKDLTAKFQAGKLIQETAPLVGGKGGGRPDLAQGGGTDPSRLNDALARARELLTA